MEVMVKEVVVCFPEVFQARKGDSGGAYYAVTCPIEIGSAAQKVLEAAISKVTLEKWGDKAKKTLEVLVEKDRVFFRAKEKRTADGDDLAGFEDRYWFKASRPEKAGPPLIIGPDRQPVEERHGKIYSGAICNVLVDVWAQDMPGEPGKRVNARLLGVQFVKDGEAMGGGARASADKFEEYADEEETAEDLG